MVAFLFLSFRYPGDDLFIPFLGASVNTTICETLFVVIEYAGCLCSWRERLIAVVRNDTSDWKNGSFESVGWVVLGFWGVVNGGRIMVRINTGGSQ